LYREIADRQLIISMTSHVAKSFILLTRPTNITDRCQENIIHKFFTEKRIGKSELYEGRERRSDSPYSHCRIDSLASLHILDCFHYAPPEPSFDTTGITKNAKFREGWEAGKTATSRRGAGRHLELTGGGRMQAEEHPRGTACIGGRRYGLDSEG
jgi:hypothetical protein